VRTGEKMDDVQLVEYYEGLWTKLEKAERVYGWLKPSYAHYVILLSIAGFQWFIRLQVSKRNKFTVYMTVIDPSKQVVGDRLILNRSISPYDNFLIEEGSFSNLKDVIRSADEKMRIRICADYLFNLSNSLVEYEKRSS
jgi:hypothetical protein